MCSPESASLNDTVCEVKTSEVPLILALLTESAESVVLLAVIEASVV